MPEGKALAEHSNPNLWALLIEAECYLAPTVPGAPVGGSFAPGATARSPHSLC